MKISKYSDELFLFNEGLAFKKYNTIHVYGGFPNRQVREALVCG